jgi:hypothetical protein
MPVVTETHQLANVLRRCECSDRLRLIARKRLVAVRQAAQIGHDKSILACELFDQWQEFALVLWPAAHAEHDRSLTGHDVVQIYADSRRRAC